MARVKSLCLCALSVSVLLAQTPTDTPQDLATPPINTASTENEYYLDDNSPSTLKIRLVKYKPNRMPLDRMPLKWRRTRCSVPAPEL